MGQGGEVCRHQTAVSRVTSQIFRNVRSANGGNGRYGTFELSTAVRSVAAFGGNPDIGPTSPNDRV